MSYLLIFYRKIGVSQLPVKKLSAKLPREKSNAVKRGKLLTVITPLIIVLPVKDNTLIYHYNEKFA